MSNINMINQAMLPTNSGAAVDGPTGDHRRLAAVVGVFQLAMLGLYMKFTSYPDSFAVADDGKPCSTRPHTHTRTARSRQSLSL